MYMKTPKNGVAESERTCFLTAFFPFEGFFASPSPSFFSSPAALGPCGEKEGKADKFSFIDSHAIKDVLHHAGSRTRRVNDDERAEMRTASPPLSSPSTDSWPSFASTSELDDAAALPWSTSVL